MTFYATLDPTIPATESSFLPGPEEAGSVLASRGGDPALSVPTAGAVEAFFIEMKDRFDALVGREGYRALLQEAHRRAVRTHAVLEKYPVSERGNPFFGGLDTRMADESAEEVWTSLTTLTAEFLELVHALGRDGEFIKQPWQAGSDPAEGQSELDSPDHESERQQAGVTAEAGTPTVDDPWHVLVLDPDPTSCTSTARALCESPEFQVRSRCVTAGEVQKHLRGRQVDFIVADAELPSEEITELCRWLRKGDIEDPPHVVITGLPEDPAVLLSFLEAGAAAFTMEEFSVPSLRVTLRLLARNESIFPLRLQHLMSLRVSELAELVRGRGLEPDLLWTLTSREGEVLLELEEGLTNREIARKLYISEGTVKSHVHQILKKLKVRDRDEAVRILQFQRAAPGKLSLSRSGFRRERERMATA